MIEVDYFDGRSSRRQAATLGFDNGAVVVAGEFGRRSAALDTVEICEGAGGGASTLQFPDGALCEIRDSAAFAAQLAAAAFVEDRDPRLEAGAVLGECGTGDGAGEDQMGTFGQAAEGLGPGGRIRCEACAGDRDQSPGGSKTRKGRAQMPGCRISAAAIDIGHNRLVDRPNSNSRPSHDERHLE